MCKTITVTGRGNIHIVPDVTRLEVNVNGVFKNYADAYEQAKENSTWMVKILEFNGICSKLAKTIRIDISANMVSQYNKAGNYTGTKQEGYKLEQQMKIDLGIDNVLLNKIIRGIGKFIKCAQINIGYTVRDPRPFQLKMLERAVKDAQEKAAIMANAAGCKLDSVESINYSRQDIHIYSEARNIHDNAEADACCAECLDITPDDLVAGEDVTVVWHLAKNSDV